MITTTVFHENNRPAQQEKEEIIAFLYDQLEQYGDAREDIRKAVSYALKEGPAFGGYVIKGVADNKIAGVVVVNKTGMKGYIPENILVYIATHRALRGQGIGKHLMRKALEEAEGNVALHVEPDNPARYLYETLGFTNKYLEMRYLKQS